MYYLQSIHPFLVLLFIQRIVGNLESIPARGLHGRVHHRAQSHIHTHAPIYTQGNFEMLISLQSMSLDWTWKKPPKHRKNCKLHADRTPNPGGVSITI